MPQHVANQEMECESHVVGLNGGMGGNACEKGAGKVHSAQMRGWKGAGKVHSVQMRGCKATMCVLCVCCDAKSLAACHVTQHTTHNMACFLFVCVTWCAVLCSLALIVCFFLSFHG